jgi:hypothetical protein
LESEKFAERDEGQVAKREHTRLLKLPSRPKKLMLAESESEMEMEANACMPSARCARARL